MQIIKTSLLVLFLALGFDTAMAADQAAVGADAPASEASIREMLELTQSRTMLDGALLQIQAMMKKQAQQAMSEGRHTPEQQKILGDMQDKMMAVYKEEMAWEKMEPMFIEIYRKSFTQSDVDGVNAFYRTKAGQAMLAKMPIVMQNTMQAMQTHMQSLKPRLEKIENDAMAQLAEAENKNKGKSKKSPGGK